MICHKCKSDIPDYTLVCPQCGAEMSTFAANNTGFNTGMNMRYSYLSMAWYKFLIYFMLFADAVMCISNAANYLSGEIYVISSMGEYTAADFYARYGSVLRYADILYMLTLIVFAVFAIITRFKLAGFKKEGPMFLYISYGINTLSSGAYLIAVSIITDSPPASIAVAVSQLVFQAVYIYLNYIYFKKRKHLFVN